jgi:hypothetical protein
MANHRLSGDKCIAEAFDGETRNLKVKMEDTALSFSLSATEDSIVSHKAVKLSTIKQEESLVVLGTSKLSIYGEPNSLVKISPVMDADLWFTAGEIPVSGVLTVEVAAARIKCNNDAHVVAI